MLAGFDEPDAGSIVKPSGLTVGYLPQDGLNHSGRTLHEEASLAFKPLIDMRAEIQSLEERFGRRQRRRIRARGDADALQRSAGGLPPPRGLQHRPEDHDRAARSRLRREDLEQTHRDLLRRLADADRAGKAAAHASWSAAARRADEPSRSRGAQLARGISRRLPARRDSRLARPVLSRRGRDPDHRHRSAQADRLRRELQRIPARARRAHGAAPADEARAGRRARAYERLHQPVPLPGDQGGAGPEPDQDGREDRADRDPARTEARQVLVPVLREERPHGVRPEEPSARRTGTAWSSTVSTFTSNAATGSR